MSLFYIAYDIAKPLTIHDIIRLAQCFQSTTPMQDLQALEEEWYTTKEDISSFGLEEQARELENTMSQQQQQQQNQHQQENKRMKYNNENNLSGYLNFNSTMDW